MAGSRDGGRRMQWIAVDAADAVDAVDAVDGGLGGALRRLARGPVAGGKLQFGMQLELLELSWRPRGRSIGMRDAGGLRAGSTELDLPVAVWFWVALCGLWVVVACCRV